MTRSVIVLDTVIRSSPSAGSRCFTTMGTSSEPISFSSIRKPRSAGTWSNTMSMTCCRTSSTGPAAISASATLVSTLRIRLDFSMSWISAGTDSSAVGSLTGDSSRSRDSSPTERMMVPASSLRGFSSSRTTRLSRASVNVIWNFPRVIRAPSLRVASLTRTPSTWVPFLDPRSTTRTPSGSAMTRAWVREMPKSRRTIWHSGERPMVTSPDSNS